MTNIGKLYIVSTPIGNLKDISFRSIEVLQNVDYIFAEDTRRSIKLFKTYNISVSMISYNEYNREKRIESAIKKIIDGHDIALITDAGTPCISDPGYRLVRRCISIGVKIISIPGASAVLTALVVSGLPTDRFVFEGFLPKKKGRSHKLKSLFAEERTIIIFESPKRLMRTLKDLKITLGNRPVVICRELTKIHEEIWRGSLIDAEKVFSYRNIKGEITLIIGKDSKNVYFD
ncbi:MAG: 16S rRNA (cytidine(1402)-2'-O)-methyltransferase [Candidatus Marinimicrobia bacterium]|nr:16S rRNA (cytidine(1402)-2'-O)-methyltransferase [Candidatus Neomarinimicrobiota bacterium]